MILKAWNSWDNRSTAECFAALFAVVGTIFMAVIFWNWRDAELNRIQQLSQLSLRSEARSYSNFFHINTRVVGHKLIWIIPYYETYVEEVIWKEKLTASELDAILWGRRLLTLAIKDTDFSKHHVGALKRHTGLNFLSLADCSVEANLADVVVSEKLETISIGNVNFKKRANFNQVPRLSHLTRLHFCKQDIDVNDLRLLTSENSRIKSLSILESTVSNEAIDYISTLESLERIDLSGSIFDGSRLKEFKKLRNLKLLFLSKTNVSWDDIEFLQQMESIEGVNFAGCVNLQVESDSSGSDQQGRSGPFSPDGT